MAESFWSAKITIGTRDEIVAQSKRLHPVQVESLADWLRRNRSGDDGIRSVTVPCFDLADPVVYVSVERIRKGPYVLVVRRDEDSGGWTLLGVYEGSEQQNTINELREVAGSIPCSKLDIR